MEYQFQMANVKFSISFPKALQIEDSFQNFFVEKQKEDVKVIFNPWLDSISCKEDILVYQGNYGIYKTFEGYAVEEWEKGYPCVYVPLTEDETTLVCYMKESKWNVFTHIGQVFQMINYERILNRKKIFLLHASFICWKQTGILFTAPSGTGKSTQAALWEKWENAEIINGDRVAVSRMNDIWTAFGIPFAGSSQIYKNESYPIRAVVVLRQGKENSLTKLRSAEAFRWLYSEITVQYWDEIYQKILAEILGDFVLEVPIYKLECLPEKSAVEILKKELEEKNGFYRC